MYGGIDGMVSNGTPYQRYESYQGIYSSEIKEITNTGIASETIYASTKVHYIVSVVFLALTLHYSVPKTWAMTPHSLVIES